MKKTFTGALTLVAAGAIAISAAHAMQAEAPTVQSVPQRAEAVQTITPPYEEVWKTDQSKLNRGSYFRWTETGKVGFDYGNRNPNEFGVNCDQTAGTNGSYFTGKNAWIITPPITLKAGVKYDYSATFGIYAKDYEYVEVFMGTQQSVEGMKTELVKKTLIKTYGVDGGGEDVTATFEVPADGTYYIGVHSTAEPKSGFVLYFTKWSISAGVNNSNPGAPTELKAVPGDGNDMVITLKAPTTTTGNTALSGMTKLEIYRDDTMIREFANPTPGMALSYTDTEGTPGVHEYKAVAYNANGMGTEAKVNGFVGINVPAAPTNVDAVITAKAGEVKVTWNAPEVDKDGYAINANSVKYNIYTFANEAYNLVAKDVKGTSYTYQAVAADGGQQALTYFVEAVTTAGVSAKVAPVYTYEVKGDAISAEPFKTNNLMVGASYKTPYFESFTNAQYTKAAETFDLRQENSTTVKAYWEPTDYLYDPYDLDNGFLRMFGYLACWADYYSGRIDLTGTTKPAMTYWYQGIKVDNQNLIKTFIDSGNGFELVKTTKCDEGEGEYHKITVDLTPYVGKTIRYMIRGLVTEGGLNNIVIDNITIKDSYQNNYSVQSITAPATASYGTDIPVSVSVRNTGEKEMPAFTIKLYRNGKEVASTQWPAKTEPDQLVSRTFKDKLGIEDNFETLEYYAEIECATDEVAADNRSETLTVKVAKNNYPIPVGAKAYRHVPGDDKNQDVKIEWYAPHRDQFEPVEVFEDFESYESFAKENEELGEWSVIDADGQTNYTLANHILPGVENEAAAFFIFDAAEASSYRSNNPHSGDKMMAALGLDPYADTRKVDDWMISPKLSGKAQTIKFWAKSYSSTQIETFEVLASASGKEIKDFKLIERVDEADFMWKEYSYDLPAGTMYFAIRRVSDNKVIFFVDDVTFTPSFDEDALQLIGYNVYRDGVKINKEPVRGSYIDKDAAKTYKDSEYAVSAVYNRGESRLSNKAKIDTTGVGAMAADEVYVEAGSGVIRVACAADAAVEVYAVDGAVVYNGLGSADIAAQTGVYVVKAAGKTVKVVVK